MAAKFMKKVLDLFSKIEELKATHEQVGQKLSLILQFFSVIEENLTVISCPRFRDFLKSVKRKCDFCRVEAESVYADLNSQRRLDPETKRIYRQFVAMLPPLKIKVEAALAQIETEETTPTVVNTTLRRSKRLASI